MKREIFNSLKYILYASLLSTSILAETRPTIALVLSGGGARGGAHVGVLRVLEEKKIPIDFIVGTSMGAFVGALYASGKSADAIEYFLINTDWREHIRTDYERADMPMRKKEVEYQYQGRVGVGVDAQDNVVLPTGIFKGQPMLLKFEKEFQHVKNVNDFSQLPIPFKAIATNIQNGNAVVLESGSLAHAVYASSSIPGGFQPIKINNLDLIDGGVSDNMPISVAKKMGADIVIAVDVSENFVKNLDVNSYFVVMRQLVNILMRKNANDSIATLEEKDILITPDLQAFSGLDTLKYKEIIQAGADATNALYDKKLKHLSLSSLEYAAYKKTHNSYEKIQKKIIDEIVILNPTYISDNTIRKKLNIHVGDELNEDTLRKDLMHIYNMGLFNSITHEILKEDGKNILKITTTPSWDNHGEIRLALGIEDDFDTHSTYSLKFAYTMFGLNQYGGEWKNDFEIGRRKKAYTELYQPLGSSQNFYIKPSISYDDRNELVPVKAIGINRKGSIIVDAQRYGASMNFGAYLSTEYKLEVGISSFKDDVRFKLLDINQKYDALPIHVQLQVDSLDNLSFPNSGLKAHVLWTKEMEQLKSDYDYEQIYMEITKPFTRGLHNLSTSLKYGDTYKQDGITSLRGNFSLGGLFNLSGFVPYSLNNENMFLGVAKYRYEIKNAGFFGSLRASLYLGMSAEIGNTWGRDESVSYDMLHKAGTVYFAADTFLGPFYLAYGFSNGEDNTIYLYLGENF